MRHLQRVRMPAMLWVAIAVFVMIGRPAIAAEKPNVVFILADDWGWGDLGCYGSRRIRTPNLDRLAEQGTLFTQFYVNGSVCSPTRAAIMTSRFPAELGVHGHFSDRELHDRRAMPDKLNPELPTVTGLLQEAGYVTGHYGKWHLQGTFTIDETPPSEYGVDEYRFAHEDDWNLWNPKNRAKSSREIVNESMDFIERHEDEPFFLNVWLLDTHATLNPTDQQMKPYEGLDPRGVDHAAAAKIYAAAATDSDKQIGRLLRRLRELDLNKETIVIFSSDNGPEDIRIRNAAHSGVGSAGPFRGRKRSLYEGGVRVPFIVRWPGHVPAGRVDSESVVSGVDLLPTLCHFAGVDLPEQLRETMDGENVAGILQGEPRQLDKPLMWEWRFGIYSHRVHQSPMLAIREGKWKLLANPDRSRLELYNIPEDPTELNNVADEHPEMAERLFEKLKSWKDTLPEGPTNSRAGKSGYPRPGMDLPTGG